MPIQLEEDILKELGVDQLAPPRRAEVLAAMTQAVLKRIILRLLQTLSDEQRTQLEEVAGSGDSTKTSQFLVANIPDYESLIREEVAKFRQDMKATVDALLA